MEIKKDVYLVGFVDWNVRDFHGLKTQKGTTYNSYLIKDEKTVLIDTVKRDFWQCLVENISKHSSLEEIDYIVINHAEPDHASSLPLILDKCKKAQIICTEKCKKILEQYYEIEGKFKVVKEGDEILLPAVEFPANIYPWLNLKWEGIRVKFIKCPNGFFDTNRFYDAITAKTRVFSISFVQFFNGYKNDLKTLGEICQKKDVFFVVDAIQGVGNQALDGQIR